MVRTRCSCGCSTERGYLYYGGPQLIGDQILFIKKKRNVQASVCAVPRSLFSIVPRNSDHGKIKRLLCIHQLLVISAVPVTSLVQIGFKSVAGSSVAATYSAGCRYI